MLVEAKNGINLVPRNITTNEQKITHNHAIIFTSISLSVNIISANKMKSTNIYATKKLMNLGNNVLKTRPLK